MLKHLVPEFHPDLSVRFKYIVEKQVPAKLKPIVGQSIDRAPEKHLRLRHSYSFYVIKKKISGLKMVPHLLNVNFVFFQYNSSNFKLIILNLSIIP